MTVTAEQAQPGRRYKTPRGSICTIESVPAEGQVRLTMEGGGHVSVPRAYPLTPAEPAATGGTDLSLIAGKAPAVVEAALAGLTLAELDDLTDRDSRMFVLELVDGERKRRAGPEAAGADHDEAPVPDRDEDGDGEADTAVDDEAPTSAACPTCNTEQALVASTKHAGALVFRPHASPTAAYCPGSSKVYERPTMTATAPTKPAGPFTTGPGVEAIDAETRITVVQRMTTLEQVAAARAVEGVQASVVRELDRQQAALEWVLEATDDMPELQKRAAAKRLENRPGCLAVVRELIARLRGLGVDPEPSVQPGRKGDHPAEVDAGSDYAGEHAGLAKRLQALTGTAVWPWADLEAVAAMTGTVRASRAALRTTADRELVRLAWRVEQGGDNRETVLSQLASRFTSLGGDPALLAQPNLAEAPRVEQPAPEVPPAAVEAEPAGEYDPEDSEHYWHGFEDFRAEVPRDQAPSEYDEVQADSWRRGWDAAKAEVPAVEVAPVEQVPPPDVRPKAQAEPTRDPLTTPRPHDVAKLTRADGSTELWVVVGYSPDMNALRGDGSVGVLVLTEHGDHPELRKAHGSHRRSGLVSWWASIPAEGERFEVVQVAVADTMLGGGWVPPADGYDYSLPPGATNARGFPRPPDELLPKPWHDTPMAAPPQRTVADEVAAGLAAEDAAAAAVLARDEVPTEYQVAVPWAEGELRAGDQVVIAECDGDGRELRRFVGELVNPDDNGALGLRWPEGKRHRDRRFSRHTGVAIGHGNGKAGLRILGRLDRPAPVAPEVAPVVEQPPVEALVAAPDQVDDTTLPFPEQVARASLGRALELLGPPADQVQPDAELLNRARRAEHQAGNREAVMAAINARLTTVRQQLADGPFADEVAHLDTGEAIALIAEHRGAFEGDAHDVHAGKREVQAALALEAKVHNRDEVISTLTASLAQFATWCKRAPADPTEPAPKRPADYPEARAWGNVAAERGEPDEPPAYDDPAARAAWSEGWAAWHAAVEADRKAAEPPAPVEPPPATVGDAAAAARARAAGKVAVRMDDLRVLEHRRGPAELWAFPEGELPQRLGPVDAPHLAPHVAALREAGTADAAVVPWRPASRRPEPTPAPTPAPVPPSPLGALGEALLALKAMGLKVDLRITSDDVKG